MSRSVILATALALASTTLAQDVVMHPALESSLDYLEPGNDGNLPGVNSVATPWGAGWIPQDCFDMTTSAGLNPEDVTTYNVQYDDCSDAWIMCMHKDSPNSIDDFKNHFGQVPVSMRNWVRHLISLPDSAGGHAYNSNGNIAIFDTADNLDVFLHETGHSIDLLGAFPNRGDDNSFHSSQVWLDNYNQDSNVPDNYATTNIVEDVAQVVVVSIFDKVVPGGFGSVEANWQAVFHQYATLQSEAGGLILPGGTCGQRLTNSAPVPQSGSSSRIKRKVKELAPMPDVRLSDKVKTIDVSHIKPFHTGEHCKKTWNEKGEKAHKGHKGDKEHKKSE